MKSKNKAALIAFLLTLIGLTVTSLWLSVKVQGNILWIPMIVASTALVGAPSAMWWSELIYKPEKEKEPFDYATSLNIEQDVKD